jgi:autotransporter-associated beta strand protein
LKLESAATLPGQLSIAASGSVIMESAGSLTRGTILQMGQNGKLTVNGLSGSTTDTFNGALNMREGGGEPIIAINPAAGQVSTVAFASYDRNTLGNSSAAGATLNLRGPNFGKGVGADEARVTFTTAPTLSSNIHKTMTITDTVTGLTRFPTNGANGIRQLLDTEYNTGAPVNGLSAANARLTAGTTTSITGDVAPGSLSLEGNNITLTSTGTANVRAGTSNGINAMLSVGTGNVISTTTLDSGSVSATAIDELIVYVEGDLRINSVIRNATGATTAPNLGITKSGPGELVLAGDNTFISTETAANKFLRINNGTVSFTTTGMNASGVADGSAKNLGQFDGAVPGGRISLHAGGLHLKGTDLGTVFVPQALHISNNGNAAVDPAGAFIEVDAGSTLKTAGIKQFSGNGPGGFTKKGAGTLEFFGGTASGVTFDRTGSGKSYLAGGSLTFSGDAANFGGMQNAGWLVASPGTTINFNSSARPTNASTRLGQVQFGGTRLNVIGNSANATTDQLGTFVFAPGGSEFALTQGAGQTTTLNATNTAGSVRRYQGGTVVISGAGLGTAAAGVTKVTASGNFNGATVGGVIPWALADTTVGGNGTAFAFYGANGITAVTTNTASITAGGNARLTASNNVAGTVNSLHLDGSGISAGAGTLRVTSGGILSSGGANSIGATTLAFGAAEGVVHAVSNLAISSDITGSAGLTKAGPGQLRLAGNNSYSSGTHVNGGTLLVNNSAGSGTGSGFVSVNAGTIGGTGTIAGPLSISGLANVAPGSGGAGTLTAGALTLASGADFNYDLADATTPGGGVNDLLVVASGTTTNPLPTDVFTLNINATAGTLGSGDYVIIDSATTLAGGIDPARWVIGSNNATDANTYAFALNGSGDLVLNVTPIGPVVSVWDKDDSISSWSASSSWVGGAPNAAGATATFGAKITTAQTVNVDGAQTVGTMNFQNVNSYTLAPATGGGSITIDGATDGAVNVIEGSHNITAPLTLAKNTTFTVTPAASTLGVTDLTATGVNVTKAGAGTMVVNHVRSNTLAVTDGTLKMAPDANAAGASKVASLSIAASARLDLSRNKLVTDTPIGTFTAGAYTGVQGEVARAYNFGSWDMPGLMTSEPDAGPTIGTTTIGVSDGAAILFLGATETGVFAGQTVTGATTIAMYTYAGDVNFDGLVDASDYGIIDNYFQFPGTSGYANGDFNYDGVIDAGDYGIIDNTFQLQGAPIPTGIGVAGAGLSGVTAVPEPASLSTIALGAASLLGRRRRRRRNA